MSNAGISRLVCLTTSRGYVIIAKLQKLDVLVRNLVNWHTVNRPQGLDDDRHFPGLQVYFGEPSTSWEQTADGANGSVKVSMTCFDTAHPTQQPTQQPTEQPTQQPTLAPTEICTALELTVANGGTTTAVTKYNGIYMKQTSLVNGRDWWKQRFIDAANRRIVGPAHEGRQGAELHFVSKNHNPPNP